MHCSNCGHALNQNLNYCQHCGSRNQRKPAVAANSPTNLFICAGGAIGVIGLIGFYPILRELLHSGIGNETIVIILVAYLTMVFLMFSVLIGLAWKRSSVSSHAPEQRGDDYAGPQTFRSFNTSELLPAGSPASVTEHTTRTLDEVPIGRR